MIDPVSGYWAKNEDDGAGEAEDPTASPRQWIVPSVQDRKNALLFQPTGKVYSQTSLATVQHALLRGLEAVFQLEEGEILAEPMPIRDERSGVLLYEATEGGAGVLTRLVAEPALLAEVAKNALEIMHFALGGGDSPAAADSLNDVANTSCVAACYRCLMSYYNQPDHELLDRRDVGARTLLLRLARSHTSGLATPSVGGSATPGSPSDATPGSLGRWMERLDHLGLTTPDREPLPAAGAVFPLVWRNHYAVAVLGGADAHGLKHLAGLGFEVVVFESSESTWTEPFRRLAAALGTKS
jgi:hypothetical protein